MGNKNSVSWKKVILGAALTIFLLGSYFVYNTFRSHTFDECVAELQELIETHPRKEIRDDLFEIIHSRTTTVEFDERLLGETSNASVSLDSIGRPVFVFSGTYLFLGDRESKQITLHHEYQHIRQILDGRFLFSFQNVRRVLLLDSAGRKRFGKEHYLSELEGYSAGCELAGHLKVEQSNCNLYLEGNKQAFKKALADFMIERIQGTGSKEIVSDLMEGYLEGAAQ